MRSVAQAQPRRPAGTKRGGQFATSARPDHIEASLSPSPPTNSAVELISQDNPQERFQIVHDKGKWVVQPTLDMTEMAMLAKVSKPSQEASDFYNHVVEKLFLGNLVADMLNTGDMIPQDATEGFPPLRSRQTPGGLNVRQRAQWMRISLESYGAGVRYQQGASHRYLPSWIRELHPPPPHHPLIPHWPFTDWTNAMERRGVNRITRKLRDLCRASLRPHLAISDSVLSKEFLVGLFHLAEQAAGQEEGQLGPPPPSVLVARYRTLGEDPDELYRWLTDTKAQCHPPEGFRAIPKRYNDRLQPFIQSSDLKSGPWRLPDAYESLYRWSDTEQYPDHAEQAAALSVWMRAVSDMTETPLSRIVRTVVFQAANQDPEATYRPKRVPDAFKQDQRVYAALQQELSS